MAETRYCALRQALEARALNLHGVLLARHGRLLFEWYAGGPDQPWGKPAGRYDYDAATLHDLRSASKSVVSLLVGIAVDRRLIGSIDQPIFDYLPEYADLATPEKRAITIRHLLTMTSGLVANEAVAYGDPANTERLMAISTDPYRTALSRRLMFAPGGHWAYDSGSTMLLARILVHATGMGLADFARDNLFGPLGIADFEWIGLRASGEPAAYGSLRLRPADLAKIGQLVLNDGTWHGRQVVSSAWLALSTEADHDGWYPDRYAMHWWRGEAVIDGRKVTWIQALGLGGQRLYVVPDLDAVVVVTGGLYDDGDQLQKLRRLFVEAILPALGP